jgi:hypothetical protein
MIGLKVLLVAQSHDPRCGRDCALARRKYGTCQQDLHVLSNAFPKDWRKGQNQGKILLGQGRHWSSSWRKMPSPILFFC